MPSPENDPIYWITKIIACAVLLQGVELLQIRRSFAPDGIWQWKTLSKEFEIFPRAVQWFLNLTLDYPRFLFVPLTQIALAIALLAGVNHSAVFIGLLFTTALTALRWRGTFNGGADYMTVMVLLMLSIDSLFPANAVVRLGCLWYLAVQTVFSYFIAGVVKLKNPDWRSGRALQKFLSSPPYDPPQFFARLSTHSLSMWLGSWSIILFETAFPLALLGTKSCTLFVCAALLFHVLNVATFGLNRFLLAWSAAYPALYFCSAQKLLG